MRISQPIFLALIFCLQLVCPARAALELKIGQNFPGSRYGNDSFATPPDANGAIGPNHFVELINGSFVVYDKYTGHRLRSSSDFTFWSNAGVTFPPNTDVSDPRVIFDPTVNRWFASSIDVGSLEVNNRALIAVSNDASPTNGWKGFAFSAASASTFADFPTLGVDSNGVYISVLVFDSIGNSLNRISLFAIPKSDLVQSTPSIARRNSFFNLQSSLRGFVAQPVIDFTSSGPGSLLGAPDNLSGNFIARSPITFDGNSFTLGAAVPITVPAYTYPINPTQPDGTFESIDDGDARLSSFCYRLGHILYAAQNVEIGDRAAIRWYKFNATDNTLIQSGIVSDTNLDLFYPSIAANMNGAVVLGFNGASTNTFVSAYAALGETVGNVTTFGKPILLKAGVANLHLLEDSDGISRFGDYSAMTPDPSDPNCFWTIQEYVSSANVWSTQIIQLQVAPKLTTTFSTNSLTLSWSTNVIGFNLESTTNLAATNAWSIDSSPLSFANGQNIVTIPTTNALSLFRLRR